MICVTANQKEMICNTIPGLGQVLVLFRSEAGKIVHPVQNSEARKSRPDQQHVPIYTANKGVHVHTSTPPVNM